MEQSEVTVQDPSFLLTDPSARRSFPSRTAAMATVWRRRVDIKQRPGAKGKMVSILDAGVSK